MKISAFTFARNVLRLGYPFRECIDSALGIADEVVVNVGLPDEDGTLDFVRSLGDARIRVVESMWNPNVRTGGYVLAQQTNIALFNCTGEWAVYLQADEVLHEAEIPYLKEQMARYREDDRVEALAPRRLHFWGDFHTTLRVMDDDYPARIVKPHRFVMSRGDAASFTVHPKYKERGRRVRAVALDAHVFHYGWCVGRDAAPIRQQMTADLWSGSAPAATGDGPETSGAAPADPDQVAPTGAPAGEPLPRQFVTSFDGSHPAVMADRVAADTFRVDLADPDWRTTMTRSERRQWRRRRFRGWLKGPLHRWFSRSDIRFLKP